LALLCRLVFGIAVIPFSARGSEANRRLNFDKHGEDMPEIRNWQGDFAKTGTPL
jgi:hypothetical protein